MQNYDLVFLGGGLASTLISRFIKLRHPHLKILVLEKNAHANWAPGESTVGVAGTFLIRDLGLSTYAYLNQLPKNGLRFIFTDESNRSAPQFDITQCSEIGSYKLPVVPTFQIDRKRIVEDIWKLNEGIGIEIRLEVEIQDLQVCENGEDLHVLTFKQRGGTSEKVTCRWLINGSGRTAKFAPIFNELSPATDDPDHCTAAGWGRYTHTGDIDLLGDDAWRKQAGFTSRYLSTNHFMGEGYWIWAIPIDRGIVSYGAVYDKKVVKQDLTQNDIFNKFLRENPISRELLKNAHQEDFQSHSHLPFKRKYFCSKNRWALIGDSFMFVDPFYSPGSDVIAREARHIEHLIGCEKGRLPELVEMINKYTHYEYEVLKALYVNQYRGFGSFEVYNIKSYWDFYAYTNTILWPFLSKCHEDQNWLKAQVQLGAETLKLVQAIQKGFQDLTSHICKEQGMERHNLGRYSSRQNYFPIEDEMLLGRYSNELSRKNHLQLCKQTVSETISCRFEIPGFGVHPKVQERLDFEAIGSFQLTPGWLEGFLARAKVQLSELK